MRTMTAGCIQVAAGGIEVEGVDALLASAEHLDLAVLPELCHLPYFPLELEGSWASTAVEIDGPYVRGLKEVARHHGTHIVAGLHLARDGRRWNSAVLIGPDGGLLEGRYLDGSPVAAYDKLHLCDVRHYGASFYESDHFATGRSAVVWDTELGRISALICYDRHFPEAWRTVRAAGAEIVCIPTASPVGTRSTFVAEIQAMALQQNVYVAMANRQGREALPSGISTDYLGLSCLVDPVGEVVALAPEDSSPVLISATFSPDPLLRARSDLGFEEHRRPDAYRLEASSQPPAGPMTA